MGRGGKRTRAKRSHTASTIRDGGCRCKPTRSSGSPDLDTPDLEIAYRFGFDAAHHFDHFPEGHPNRAVHGHSFQVEVALEGSPQPATGFVADFGDVDSACAAVRSRLDHRMLNEIPGLSQPSLENLALWIWNSLRPALPALSRVTVRRDSAGQSCTYRGI